MKNLRRHSEGGTTVLQTPVVELVDAHTGRRARLLLTAHLGDQRYFERLREIAESETGSIFYEGVIPVSSSAEHWDERYHSFLRHLREDVYAGIAKLGLLAFQGEYLAPAEGWIAADVTCCELAERMRVGRVRLRRYELGLAALKRLIGQAEKGDPRARAGIERAIKWGLIAISVTAVFRFLTALPNTHTFNKVVNEWRSGEAVRIVLAQHPRQFTLIYGAAHGDEIIRALEADGFREVNRRWLTVFAT